MYVCIYIYTHIVASIRDFRTRDGHLTRQVLPAKAEPKGGGAEARLALEFKSFLMQLPGRFLHRCLLFIVVLDQYFAYFGCPGSCFRKLGVLLIRAQLFWVNIRAPVVLEISTGMGY